MQDQPAGHAVPEAGSRGCIAGAQISDIRLDLCRWRRDQLPGDAQPERCGGRGDQHHEGLVARARVGEQQLVTADALDLGPWRHVDAKRTVGKAASQVGVGQAGDDHTLVVATPACRHVVRAVIAVQRDVVGHEQTARGALQHACREPQLVPIDGCPAAHLEQQPRLGVQPARATGRHLEGGWLVEQQPGAVTLDEQALAMRAVQPEVRVRCRQEAIDADMPLREHRMEDAAHPDGRRQRRFVGHQLVAGAQDLPMRAQARALLGRQHDMRAVGAEEGQQLAALHLGRQPVGAEVPCQQAGIQRCRGQQGGVAEERGRTLRGGTALRARRHGFAQGQRPIGEAEVDGAADPRMIRFQPCEEAGSGARLGRQRQRGILHNRHRMFVLAAHPRQALGFQRGRWPAVARGKPMQLQCVGAEAVAVAQRSDAKPWLPPADREVLPHGEHRPERRVLQWRVIEVLADVVLVQPHRAVVGQRNVLCVDQIDPACLACGVLQRDMPEPRRRRPGQHQRHAKAQARPLAGDLDAVPARADSARAAGPEQRRPFDAGAMAAQIEVGRTALELVAEKGVDHHVAVIDASDGAVPVHLHDQPRWAGEVIRAVQHNSMVRRNSPAGSALGPAKISTSPASNTLCRSGPRYLSSAAGSRSFSTPAAPGSKRSLP